MKAKIDDIKVGSRLRKDIGQIDGLVESIKKTNGSFVTIWVDKDLNLIAGYRRLMACRAAGVNEINVLVGSEMDELLKRELELEENVIRKDMTDEEKVEGIAEIHRLYQQKYGHTKAEQTGDKLGMSSQNVYIHLQIAKAKTSSPRVADTLRKSGVSAAYRQVLYEQQMAVQAELVKASALMPTEGPALAPDETQNKAESTARKMLKHGDSLVLIRELPDESIDLVYTDPPYGVDIAKLHGKTGDFSGDLYQSDEPENYKSLMYQLSKDWSRVLKPDSWLFLWCSFKFIGSTIQVMETAGFTYRNPPFIWVKVGGSHGCFAPTLQFASACDIALVFSKGNPILLKQGQPNYSLETPLAPALKVHPLERPLGLNAGLLSTFVHAGCVVLDTFAGSGSTLKACVEIGVDGLGFELEERFYNSAHLSLVDFIKLKISPESKTSPSPAQFDEALNMMLLNLGWTESQVRLMTIESAEQIFQNNLTPSQCSILPDGSVFVVPSQNL